MTKERKILYDTLTEVVGEDGCCVTCGPDDIYKDEEGWQLFLDGFMAPWFLGKTVDEARASIREFASQGFGLS